MHKIYKKDLSLNESVLCMKKTVNDKARQDKTEIMIVSSRNFALIVNFARSAEDMFENKKNVFKPVYGLRHNFNQASLQRKRKGVNKVSLCKGSCLRARFSYKRHIFTHFKAWSN